MNKTTVTQQASTSTFLPSSGSLLQRKCACGNHTMAGGECTECAKKKTALQRKLTIGASNDPLELEADRIADQVVAKNAAPLPVSKLVSGQLQREEAPKEKTNEEKFQEGLEKLGEAFLETPIGRELLEKIKQDKLIKGATEFGKEFVSTWPGKIVTGAAATGAVAALAATHKELPAQIPEIPLDSLIPGLSVKLAYKGPVDKPTEAMITFKFTEQQSKDGTDKKTISESDKIRAETARMVADHDKFQAGLRYPPGSPEDLQQKAQQEEIRKGAQKYVRDPLIGAVGKKYPMFATPQPKNGLQLTMPKPSFGVQSPSLLGDEFKLRPPGEQKKKLDELPLQRKLSIGASNDPLEQEADRVADQVVAAPRHSAVNTTVSRIQRSTGQTSESADAAPDSVDRVLASSGRPLEPALRQDMEQRFRHDFSRVRVHTDSTAEQSARDVNANAYTVGHNIVFGPSRFAPATQEGKRLIAHELTHVVQQSDREFPIAPLKSSVEVLSTPVVHGKAGIRIAREPKKPGNQGIVLEIELRPGMNANDVRRKVTVLDQLASRGRLVRAASPIERQTVPDGVAAREYQKVNPKVSTEYKYQILEQAHKQIGPNSPNYEPVRWRKFFDLWARSQGDHVQDLQLSGADAVDNMWLIDGSTNEDLGVQIRAKLRKVKPGTKITAVRMKPGSPSSPPSGNPPSAPQASPAGPSQSPPVKAGPSAAKPATGGVSAQTPKAPAPGQLPPVGDAGSAARLAAATAHAKELGLELTKQLRIFRVAAVLKVGVALYGAINTFLQLKGIVDMAQTKLEGKSFVLDKEIAQAQGLDEQSRELERDYPSYSEAIQSKGSSLLLAPADPTSLRDVVFVLFLVFSDVADLRDNLGRQIPLLRKALNEIKAKRAVAEAILNEGKVAGTLAAATGSDMVLANIFTAWVSLGELEGKLNSALTRFEAIEPQVKADAEFLRLWVEWLKEIEI